MNSFLSEGMSQVYVQISSTFNEGQRTKFLTQPDV